MSYGASKDEWAHFDLILGLGADLLPVVSNPQAEVSADSKMKEIGKTPSLYNKARKVVGIPGWTGHVASDHEIGRWMAEPDYGICLQTRMVRAIDIDVADPTMALAVREFIEQRLAGMLPMRHRNNSGKCLLAFTMPGEFAKRKLVVEGGIIEFLANGQQFIAIGTHPSGVRYEWAGGLPMEFPALTVEEFEALWSALADRFAIGAPTAGGAVTLRKRGANVAMPDPVVEFLEAEGRVLGEQRDGSLLIACPWEAEHSTGSTGDGSTVWFPAGTNGYERGHFKCLHGHCEGRTDADFFDAVGYAENVADEFEVMTVEAEAEDAPLPSFRRDSRGRIEAIIDNVNLAMARPDYCGVEIGRDEFRDEIMLAKPGSGQWRPFRDSDYTRLRIHLERRGFKPVGREMMRDVVQKVAEDHRFDSAQLWLQTLTWDGTPRVERFLIDYFCAEDTPYTRAVSRYIWTALAGRVMSPGIKADMVPILVGHQGAGKSTAVSAMAPAPEFFCEISFNEKDEDLARKMRGRLVAEIGELRGLHTKELESIKAFITRTHENWIPKYREFATQFPRRLVFIGTTNKEQFLADETGNRRWLPVPVACANVDALRRDRDQLWAEGRALFAAGGVDFRDAERLGAGVHDAHTITEPWTEIIEHWLDEPDQLSGERPRDREFLRANDVLRDALRIDPRHVSKREEMRIATALRNCGYERAKKRIDGKPVSLWVPSVPTCSHICG